MQGCPRQVWDGAEPNAADLPAILLGGDGKQRFVLRQTPGHVRPFRAPIGLINLHGARQAVAAGANYRPAQLMQHGPRRLVTSQPQDALQTKGADAVLLAGNLPDGAKPDRQRQMAVLKDGSGRDRHLVAAMAAKPAIAPYRPSFGSRTARAHPARGPTQRRQILNAGLLAGKTPLRFQQRPWIIFVHDQKHYRLWPVASSK